MAMLLALASSPEELEVLMISVTYGNVPLDSCLRNVVGLFHVLEHEMEWRKTQGKPLGYEVLRTYKPIVAVGPEHALEDEILMADNFRKLIYVDKGETMEDESADDAIVTRWRRWFAWRTRGCRWKASD